MPCDPLGHRAHQAGGSRPENYRVDTLRGCAGAKLEDHHGAADSEQLDVEAVCRRDLTQQAERFLYLGSGDGGHGPHAASKRGLLAML